MMQPLPVVPIESSFCSYCSFLPVPKTWPASRSELMFLIHSIPGMIISPWVGQGSESNVMITEYVGVLPCLYF